MGLTPQEGNSPMPPYARHQIVDPNAPPAPARIHPHSRSLIELYQHLQQTLEAANLIDEYFSMMYQYDTHSPTREIEARGFGPIAHTTLIQDLRYRWMAVYPVTGGNEGHYVHVDLIWEKDYQTGRVPLFLYKTFAGLEQVIKVAGILATELDV